MFINIRLLVFKNIEKLEIGLREIKLKIIFNLQKKWDLDLCDKLNILFILKYFMCFYVI